MRLLPGNARCMPLAIALGSALAFVSIGCRAQSLDPQKPAPLQPGPNTGTVDNSGGANYFYFWAGPGETTVTATYKNVNTWVGPKATNLTVELYDEHKTWVSRATIS